MKNISSLIREAMDRINETSANFTVTNPTSGEPQDILIKWTEHDDGILPEIIDVATQAPVQYVSLSMKDQQRVHDYIMHRIHTQDPKHEKYNPEVDEEVQPIDEAPKKYDFELEITNPQPFPDSGTEEEQLAFQDEIKVGVTFSVSGKYRRQTHDSPEEHPEVEYEVYNLETGAIIPHASLDKYALNAINNLINDALEAASMDDEDYRDNMRRDGE